MKDRRVVRAALAVWALVLSARPIGADELGMFAAALKPDVSASVGIVPWNSWLSGTIWGVVNGTQYYDRLRYEMDTTAFTSYSASVYFPRPGIGFGVNLDVDDSFIGDVERILGYLSVGGFMGRIQASSLRGRATWVGNALSVDHPTETAFDNRYLNVDILRRLRGDDAALAFGIGYTSFQLPVQLDLLTLGSNGEVASPVDWTYQENMKFRIYSVLFGMNDPLDSVAMGGDYEDRTGMMRPGFNLWLYAMDRFGLGVARVSDYEEETIETITSRTLEGRDSLAMMVDFDMTLGVRWIGEAGKARLGVGLGYRLGGLVILCLPLTGSPDSQSSVTASPDFYLVRGGVVLKGAVSW